MTDADAPTRSARDRSVAPSPCVSPSATSTNRAVGCLCMTAAKAAAVSSSTAGVANERCTTTSGPPGTGRRRSARSRSIVCTRTCRGMTSSTRTAVSGTTSTGRATPAASRRDLLASSRTANRSTFAVAARRSGASVSGVSAGTPTAFQATGRTSASRPRSVTNGANRRRSSAPAWSMTTSP